MPELKTTQYFKAMRIRPDRAIIKDEWIQHVIDHPIKEMIQQDGRIRRWAPIAEMSGRYFAGDTASRLRNRSQHFL